MPLDKQATTLRQSPYFDDYDETKNFHRVLFKPSVAVQARELTQLQTILQNQIERFGDNIFQTGTIIKGCSLITDTDYSYVKLFDLQPNGETYSISGLVNTFVVESTSNLHAVVVNYAQGGQQLDPDLNTLYLKYLNTGVNAEKAYSNNSVLTVYDRNYQVESIKVNLGGTLYSNSDVVVFSNSAGSGAAAQIITYANGTIRSVNVTEPGSGYITAPTLSITTSTGSGADLTALNYIAQVQVANSIYTAPVGRGTAIKTSDGVIYQKGHFIRVQAHETILSKYDTSPNNVVAGFVTNELVVNSNSDQTLLDNAGNTTNYTAPGADRLKLQANLVALSTANAASNNQFFALYEYENGRVVKDRTVTQFNSINKELSRRTFEESGNYVVSQFPMYSETITGNTTHVNLTVGAGIGYVQGNRVEVLNNTRYPVRKSTDTRTDTTQSIATNYGGYVMVKEYMGNFDIKQASTIQLHIDSGVNPGQRAISSGAGIGTSNLGVQIGTARVRSVAYDSGIPGSAECQYRVYLFDVKMSPGYTFKDVRSIVNGSSAVADVIWDASLGYAVQYDTEFDKMLFDTGTFAVQQLDNESVVVRTSNSTGSFALGGQLQISLGSGLEFPYQTDSTLNSVEERDFIIIPSATTSRSANNNGVANTTSGQTNVTGTGTLFTTQYQVGQYIKIGNNSISGNVGLITRIYSNTLLECATAFGTTWGSNSHTTAFPANVPIDMSASSRTIAIDATGTTVTVDLGGALTTSVGATVYHEARYDSPAVRVKTANTYYVRLSTSKLANTTQGPWCLGIPDVIELTGVYIGSGNNYANTSAVNYRDQFVLDSGQNDNFYGLAHLKKRPGSTLNLTSSNCLLVKFKAMTHGAGYYISTESYASAVDDVTEPLPENRIRTQDIPVYVSPKTGRPYDLRNVIDFRPLAANTAAYYSNNVNAHTTATVDPSNTVSFAATDKNFPSPTKYFTASCISYMARRDRVIIDKTGKIRVVEGAPSNSPSVPVEPDGAMTIGIVDIPPYPSLSAKDATDYGRPDLGVYVLPQQNRRYTMKDISDIESRISRLEYYTLLNTLETNTKQLVIPGEANTSIERFKNGFFVDPMTDYNISNLQDPEYKALIDTVSGVARPYFADVRVDLKLSNTNSTNVSQHGDHVLLNYTDVTMFSQQAATRDRTLVDQLWKYVGNVTTVPSFDNYYDISNNAVSVVIDLASPLTELAKATAAALAPLTVSTSIVGSVNTGSAFLVSTEGRTQTWRQNVNTSLQDTKTTITGGQNTMTTSTTVSSLSSLELQQYIRDQRIYFVTTGLRPAARHYAYFDGQPISARACPCSVDLTLTTLTPSSFVTTGSIGDALVANSIGAVAGYIDIPKTTYYVGERSVVLMDVDSVASESTATSRGFGKFTAYAFKGNRTDLSISTKTIDSAGGGGFNANTYLSEVYYRNDHTDFLVQLPNPDPLAQTFKVSPTGDQTDGVHVTGVDLFFKSKDTTRGVTIELRETINGVPSSTIVPFSRVYKPSSLVNTSNNASAVTTFTFDTPCYLRAGYDYALVIYPDANSPEYRIFTAQVGQRDVANSSIQANQNWGLGTMFYSTSGSAWTAVQDEDIKFTMRRAKFSNLSGTAVLTNGDYEFLTVNNSTGAVRGGEDIAQLHPSNYINTTITTNTSNNIVYTGSSVTSSLAVGDGVLIIYGKSQSLNSGNVQISSTTVTNAAGESTSFDTAYSAGAFIKFGTAANGEIRQIVAVTNSTSMTIDSPVFSVNTTSSQHYGISPSYQVSRVLAANSSSITLNKVGRANTTSTLQATMQKAVVGVVDTYDYGNNRIYITKSTSANDTFKILPANNTYRGTLLADTTDARADVVSIDNINVNFFKPYFSNIVTPGTSISLTGTLTQNSGVTDTQLYELGMLNKLTFSDDAIIKSRSNEIVGTVVTKSFKVDVDLSTSSLDTSPVLDVNPISVVVTRNLINDSLANENTRYGSALSKYISKRLTLAEGMDAEDIKVFVTAYKPPATNVDVYAKVLNFSDGELFDDKDWTLLEQETSDSVYSDTLDSGDFREFVYTFPRTPPSIALSGVAITYSNTTITGVDTSFTASLVNGDFVKVVRSNSLTDYDIVQVANVVSGTVLTTTTALSFTSTGCVVEKVTQPKAAFKYTRNSNIVRYHGISGAAYDTYKYLAIKVVLRSPYNYLVPYINDVRALAVSV